MSALQGPTDGKGGGYMWPHTEAELVQVLTFFDGFEKVAAPGNQLLRFEKLNVDTQKTDMIFVYTGARRGIDWGGNNRNSFFHDFYFEAARQNLPVDRDAHRYAPELGKGPEASRIRILDSIPPPAFRAMIAAVPNYTVVQFNPANGDKAFSMDVTDDVNMANLRIFYYTDSGKVRTAPVLYYLPNRNAIVNNFQDAFIQQHPATEVVAADGGGGGGGGKGKKSKGNKSRQNKASQHHGGGVGRGHGERDNGHQGNYIPQMTPEQQQYMMHQQYLMMQSQQQYYNDGSMPYGMGYGMVPPSGPDQHEHEHDHEEHQHQHESGGESIPQPPTTTTTSHDTPTLSTLQ
eukprot:m.17410 g.17410  ORF g.17410 m.17410 type:complete len:346 (+) comp9297_c0_seq1:131-1168(+)